MRKFELSAALILAFVLGFGINNYAKSSNIEYKVAKIDVQKLVSSSPQFIAIKKDQDAKAIELQKWAQNAQAQIAKEKDKKKQAELSKKYDKEFKQKLQDNAKNSKKKLDSAEVSITKAIENKSKAMGYNLVFAKGVVLYGADDITSEVIKAIK